MATCFRSFYGYMLLAYKFIKMAKSSRSMELCPLNNSNKSVKELIEELRFYDNSVNYTKDDKQK